MRAPEQSVADYSADEVQLLAGGAKGAGQRPGDVLLSWSEAVQYVTAHVKHANDGVRHPNYTISHRSSVYPAIRAISGALRRQLRPAKEARGSSKRALFFTSGRRSEQPRSRRRGRYLALSKYCDRLSSYSTRSVMPSCGHSGSNRPTASNSLQSGDEPRSAVDHGSRARTHLANERTFLAWLRTGLSLTAVGLAVAGLLPVDLVPGFPYVRSFSVLLVLSGTMMVLYGASRYVRAYQQIETGVVRSGQHGDRDHRGDRRLSGHSDDSAGAPAAMIPPLPAADDGFGRLSRSGNGCRARHSGTTGAERIRHGPRVRPGSPIQSRGSTRQCRSTRTGDGLSPSEEARAAWLGLGSP